MMRTTSCVLLLICASSTLAAEGDAALKQAIDQSLTANSGVEQTAVIAGCEQALADGLSESDAQLAHRLAARMLAARGKSLDNDGRLLATAGQSVAARQVLQQALANYEAALKHDPRQLSALLGVAGIHTLPGGNAAHARQAVHKALEIDAKSVEAYRIRARLDVQAGKLDDATADLQQALVIDDHDAATWELMGSLHLAGKKWKLAQEALDRAIELEPENAEHYFRRAQLHLSQSDSAAALADLNRALSLRPRFVEALQLRANQSLRSGQHQRALDDLDMLVRVRPTNRSVAAARGRLLAQLKQLDAQIEALETQLAGEAVRTTELRLELAPLYVQAGKPKQALAMYSRVLAQHPQLADVHFARGDVYITTGQRAEAKADYEQALKSLPNDPTLLNNLAWLLCTSPDDALRDGPRALELSTRACELTQHKVATLLGTLSAAYAETGNFDEAIQWAEKADALSNGAMKEHFADALATYRAGKPFRDTGKKPEEE